MTESVSSTRCATSRRLLTPVRVYEALQRPLLVFPLRLPSCLRREDDLLDDNDLRRCVEAARLSRVRADELLSTHTRPRARTLASLRHTQRRLVDEVVNGEFLLEAHVLRAVETAGGDVVLAEELLMSETLALRSARTALQFAQSSFVDEVLLDDSQTLAMVRYVLQVVVLDDEGRHFLVVLVMVMIVVTIFTKKSCI